MARYLVKEISPRAPAHDRARGRFGIYRVNPVTGKRELVAGSDTREKAEYSAQQRENAGKAPR